jgi:hypothetical protein
MKVWTLEVIKADEIETADGDIVSVEEKIIAGVYATKQDALFYWTTDFKGEYDDYDLTEWDV